MGDQEKPVSLASKKMKNAHLGFLFFLGSTLRLIVHNEKWLISYLEEGPLIVPDLLSYRSAKEVAFLLSKDVNPHNFQSCIPSPLFIMIARLCRLFPNIEIPLFILFDVSTAFFIYLIFDGVHHSPIHACSLYLFNPATISANAIRSGSTLVNFCISGSILGVMHDHFFTSAILMAVGTSIDPTVMVPLLLSTITFDEGKRRRLILTFLLALLVINFSLYKYLNDSRFIFDCLKCGFAFKSLKPNIGVFWYLMGLMFPLFRNFFNAVIQILTVFFPMPLAYRFRRDPLFLTGIILLSRCVVSAHPTLPDLSIPIILLLFSTTDPFKENVLLLPGILSLVTIYSLLPAYWYHWIDLGHDYVNVYFLTALISNFVLVFMIIDLVRSRLLLHLVAENPGLSVSEVHQK